ncbi:MAG: DNA replication/repair protein RecF [Agarilytica sp.]
MPHLSTLVIQNLRNLNSVNLSFSPGVNVLTGSNGAGKTSILEAIAYLSTGRSFRTNKYRNIITEGEDQLLLRGDLHQDNLDVSQLAVLRNRGGEFKIKRNKEKVASASELARQFPLLVLDGHSFNFFEGSPKERRKLFDWLVFHVKHSFQEHWLSTLKCYKQRNSLLRSDKMQYSDLEPWDQQIAALSLHIVQSRHSVFTTLSDVFSELAVSFHPELTGKISVECHHGWKSEISTTDDILADLKNSFERDRTLGYSTLGPHKADIKIRINKKPVVEALSRGQQKKLVSALYLAMIKVLEVQNAVSAVFVADDLSAELDNESLRLLLQSISSGNKQSFVTAIDGALVESQLNELGKSYKMFHVKHGECSSRDEEPA